MENIPLNKNKLESWQIGDRIGGIYEIREILGGQGKSGMGIVYICYYKWHQKLYAVKTYQDQFITNQSIVQDFFDEANLWMELGKHPNIVQANWVHTFDGRIYIVMEYIPKDNLSRLSLADHLKLRNTLPFTRSLIWALQFCDGMINAISKGLKVHRDIKPDNILITLDKTLKITDFGLARVYKNVKRESGVAGSIPWMSPEQFNDDAECTPQSDIYSFGIILFQMISGSLPFNSDLKGSAYFKHMKQLHETGEIAKLDSPLFPVIQKCLEKNPENRFNSFQDLRVELSIVWYNTTKLPLPSISNNPVFTVKEINQKGVAHYQLGQSKEALFYHDQAIQMDPTYPNAWNDKGNALSAIGMLEDAETCYDHAMEIDAEFIHPVVNKAGLISDKVGLEEGILLYDKALGIDDEFTNAWQGKALNLIKLGKYFESISCCDKALEINRRDSFVWYLKAFAFYSLYNQKRRFESIFLLENASKAIDNSLIIYPSYIAALDLSSVMFSTSNGVVSGHQ
jgi:serine/threonine protein kinase